MLCVNGIYFRKLQFILVNKLAKIKFQILSAYKQAKQAL